MGIRVHKAMGYGVPDLATTPCKSEYGSPVTCDPMLDNDKLRDFYESAYQADVKDFRNFLAEHQTELAALIRAEWLVGRGNTVEQSAFEVKLLLSSLDNLPDSNWNATSAFIHEEEFGLANVALVIPPTMHRKWFRYDDDLDYVEERVHHQSIRRMERLDEKGLSGFYPWDGFMVRIRPPQPGLWEGQTLPFTARENEHFQDSLGPFCMVAQAYNQLMGYWDVDQPGTGSPEVQAHLRNDWRCRLPAEVLGILLYYQQSGCFPQGLEAFRDRLRPLLYVWWS